MLATWVKKRPLLRLRALRLQFRRKLSHLEYLADFDQTVLWQWASLGPLKSFLFRFDLNHPETCNHFLGFGEGTVGHDPLTARHTDARAFGRGMEPFGSEKYAGFRHFLVELEHRGDKFLVGSRDRLLQRFRRSGQ